MSYVRSAQTSSMSAAESESQGSPSISLGHVLQQGWRFKVPSYQRGYAWEFAQLEALWKDLTNPESDAGHYLGTLVLHREAGKIIRNVIDGQQRLTTLSLLIKAFLPAEKAVDELIALGSLDDYRFYKELLREGPKAVEARASTIAQRRLHATAVYFAERAREPGAKELIEKVLKTQLMVFGTRDLRDATRIFHSLNTGGVRLSELDIVRNKLFQVAIELGGESEPLIAEIETAFDRINRQLTLPVFSNTVLTDLAPDPMLKAHWILFCPKLETKIHIGLELSEFLNVADLDKRRDRMLRYLHSLSDYSEIYRLVTSPYHPFGSPPEPKIHQALKSFHRLGSIREFAPLLMACVKAGIRSDEPGKWAEVINLVETSAFRRVVGNSHTNKGAIRSLARELAKTVDRKASFKPERVMLEFSQEVYVPWWGAEDAASYGDEAEEGTIFVETLLKRQDFYLKHQGIYHYMMFEFQAHLAREAKISEYSPNENHWLKSRTPPPVKEGVPVPFRDLQIEHIRPQSDGKSVRWVHRLGNLTLATEYANKAKLRTLPFKDKAALYSLARSNSFIQENLLRLAGEPMPSFWAEEHCEMLEAQFLAFARKRWGDHTDLAKFLVKHIEDDAEDWA